MYNVLSKNISQTPLPQEKQRDSVIYILPECIFYTYKNTVQQRLPTNIVAELMCYFTTWFFLIYCIIKYIYMEFYSY